MLAIGTASSVCVTYAVKVKHLKKYHETVGFYSHRLNQARREAEALAYQEMDADMFAAIEARQIQKQMREQAAGRGEYLDIDESLNIRN